MALSKAESERLAGFIGRVLVSLKFKALIADVAFKVLFRSVASDLLPHPAVNVGRTLEGFLQHRLLDRNQRHFGQSAIWFLGTRTKYKKMPPIRNRTLKLTIEILDPNMRADQPTRKGPMTAAVFPTILKKP